MAEEKAKKIPFKQYAKNAYKYRYLMQEIVRKNVKLQYRNSFLGIFWTMLQPFLTMLVLVFIFTKVFGKASDGIVCYPVYLLTGRLLYEFYTQSTNRAMRSIRNSASVLKKVYVPKYIYPDAYRKPTDRLQELQPKFRVRRRNDSSSTLNNKVRRIGTFQVYCKAGSASISS